MGWLQILKNWLLFLWFPYFSAVRGGTSMEYSLGVWDKSSPVGGVGGGGEEIPSEKGTTCWVRDVCVPDSQSWKQALCRNQETILCATHRRRSSTPKCGCLCHFNWSVFVKWGLYLLIAWGLCLPSLVEAKWQGSCELSRCIFRHFPFQYQCCLIRELLWSKRRRVQGLQGGITPNYSNNC